MEITRRTTARTQAILDARRALYFGPVFLDTETSGLGPDAEICDLAIIDWNGAILFNHLIRPRNPVGSQASSVHGITNEMLASEKSYMNYSREINRILGRKMICAYNSTYDMRMLYQSVSISGCTYYPAYYGVFDVMQCFSAFNGDYDISRGSYRWIKLGLAAEICKIPVSDILHRAMADAELTRRLLWHIAQQSVSKEVDDQNQSATGL